MKKTREVELSPGQINRLMALILRGMAEIQEREGFSDEEIITGHLFAIGVVLQKKGIRIDLRGSVIDVLEPLAKGFQHRSNRKSNFH